MRHSSRFLLLPAFLCAALIVGTSARADGWREGVPMTTARAYAGGALVGDDLYVIGGSSTSGPRSLTEIYDTVGDIWRASAALPVGLEQFGIVAADNKIYVAGGYETAGPDADTTETESNALWIYDLSLGSWVSGPAMPLPRVGLNLASVGGKIYAIGGSGPNAGQIFVFDPQANRWTTSRTSLPEPRSDSAIAVVGDAIYIIGGLANHVATPRVDIFEPISGTWRVGPALPSARSGHIAAVLDGKIHVTGGQSISPPKTYPDHFVFDGGKWSRAAPLPTPRHGAIAAAAHGKLFVVGGSPGAGVYTVFTSSDVVDVYSAK
ncbi:MAG TPA: kelch repeat-containing protein [Parvibaculum sp.]|jgi:N-acetylneuraminic acid mutarotase